MRKSMALVLLTAIALYAVRVEVLTLTTVSLPTALSGLRACKNYAIGIDNSGVVHLVDLTTGQDIATYQPTDRDGNPIASSDLNKEYVDLYCDEQSVYVAVAYEYTDVNNNQHFMYKLLVLNDNTLEVNSSFEAIDGDNYARDLSSSNPLQVAVYNDGGTITLVAFAALVSGTNYYVGYYKLPIDSGDIGSVSVDDFTLFTDSNGNAISSTSSFKLTGATHVDDNFIVQFTDGTTTYTYLGTGQLSFTINGAPLVAYGNSNSYYLITYVENKDGSKYYYVYDCKGNELTGGGISTEPTFALISNPVTYSYDENAGTATQVNANILALVYTSSATLHIKVLSTNIPLETDDFQYTFMDMDFVPNYMPADIVYGISGTTIQPLKAFAYEGASNQVVVSVGTYIYNNIIAKLNAILDDTSNIKNTLSSISQTLDNVDQNVQSILDTVNQIKTGVDNLANVPQTLQDIIDLINQIDTNEIQPIYEAVQQIQSDMGTVLSAVNTLTTSVNTLTSTVNNMVSQLNSISDTLTQTSQTLSSITDQLSQIEQDIVTLSDNLDQYQSTITSQLQNLQTQTSNIYNLLVNDVIPTLDNIQSSIQDLSNDVQMTYDRVVKLETYLQGNITELQNAISQAKAELQSAIESANSTLQSQIEAAINALDQIQNYVNQIQSQLSALDTIATSLEQLNTTLNTLNTTTTELLQTANSQVSTLSTISQKIDEMMSLLNSIAQKVETLQPATKTETVTVTTTTGGNIAGPWLLALTPSLLAKKLKRRMRR